MTEASRDWLTPVGPPWTSGPPRLLLDNPWFSVEQYAARAPTGAPADYYVQRVKALAVGALPLSATGEVTLVGQWRFPLGAYSWEIPEGGAPKTEDPLAGAQRELREEAGLLASSWRQVLTLQLSNASSDEVAFGYLATGLSPVSRDLDPTEDLKVVRVPFQQALAAAAAGRIQDAITVAMLFRVHHMAYVGELEPDLAGAVLGAGQP